MKNNKKIYLLTALTMLACGQELSAMGAARKAAQHLWDYKFALVGTGLVGNAAFEYKHSREWVKQELMRVIQTSPIARVPKNEAPKLLKSLHEVGNTIPNMKLFFVRYQDNSLIPCIESSRIDNIVCFRINDAGQLALVSSKPNRFGFCAEDLYPIIKHEKEHVESRHVEERLAVKAAFTPLNFFAGVGAYKAVSACAQRVSGPKKLAVECVAAGVGLGTYCCARMSNYYAEKAHDRHCERVADGAVLRSDEEMIKTHLSFFERAEKIKQELKEEDPSYQTLDDMHPFDRPHLTDSKRILAAHAELARREVAKK